MSSISDFVISAVRSVVGTPPTISDLESTVVRSEAKIADLNSRADQAAEDGDASAIEGLEVSLSVERRLLAVAKRTLADAAARRDAAIAAEAEAAEAARLEAIEKRKAELDALLEPRAVHGRLADIDAHIITANAELLAAAAEHDAVFAEHARLHAERAALGGVTKSKIEYDVAVVNLALQTAGDDITKLARVIGDGRSFVPVTSAVAPARLREAIEDRGLKWVAPPLAVFPVPGTAYAEIRQFARGAATVREIYDFAIETLNHAGAAAAKARIEQEESDPARVAGRERIAAMQDNAHGLPDCSVKPAPAPEPFFEQFH